MAPTYRIEILPAGEATVCLPAAAAGRAGAVSAVTLEVGSLRVPARLDLNRPHRPGHIGVTADLVSRLHLPPDCLYRLRVYPRRVRIGPVVGILAAPNGEHVSTERLRALANHLLVAPHRGGLFLALDRDAIDPAAPAVRGYRYVAQGAGWEPGRFPLPQVIFRRYGVTLDHKLAALRAVGVHVFNERPFGKWEAWRWLAGHERLRGHLPDTAPLAGRETVLAMLGRYPAVFVKPVWGSLGARIVRVERADRGFALRVGGAGPVRCPDPQTLRSALDSLLPRPAIVQQGLDLAEAGGRLVDFRVMLQKDGAGRWTVPGIVGRCGAAALFTSNMATGGFPLPAEDGLALLFGPGAPGIFRRRQELAELGLAVGEALDRGGLILGDLGLDMAYDRAGHPWIIEANNRDPDHNIAWEAGSWPLFYRLRTLPMAYACYLAGFGAGGEGP